VLAVAGCSTAPRLGPQAGQLPPRVELTGVPFFAQDEFQCGPAALATLLTQRGIAATPASLKERVFLPGRQGSLQVELVAAAREHDLIVYPLGNRLDDLLEQVSAGNPVLVLQNLAFSWYPRWHFAVVVGYDRGRGELILRSGTTRRWITDLASFDATWARGQRWAVVLLPAQRLPAGAELRPWLRAAGDLQQTGHGLAASEAYRMAVHHWPEQGLAWFALGNARYAAGNAAEAAEAWRRAVTVEPQLAAAWGNLAQVLAEQGCAGRADHAQRCAQRLAPQESRFREVLPQVVAGTSCASLPDCPR